MLCSSSLSRLHNLLEKYFAVCVTDQQERFWMRIVVLYRDGYFDPSPNLIKGLFQPTVQSSYAKSCPSIRKSNL